MRTLLDGLDIPPPRATAAPAQGYRSAPAPDFLTRYLVWAACGLGGLLAVSLTGWLVMGRGAAPVPVIEADSRPVRVKPDNPGGLQVAGADEVAAGPQMMAPAAETPAPQALRAQLAPPAPAPAVAAPTANTATPPVASRPPPVAQPVPIAPPVAPTAAGKVVVQLAALDTEALGRSEWERLSKKMPALLGSRQPQIVRAEVAGKAVWRIRTGGFTDVAEATAFCMQVKAKGGACSLAF